MTEYELRKSFIEIFLLDGTENEIGRTKVNLYFICIGPFHQNFSLGLKNKEESRIYFDFKISQVIEIELNSIKAELDLLTKHPGEKFNFSIKTIVGHNTTYNVSSPSYTVRVKLDDKDSQQEINLTPDKKKSIKGAGKEIPEGKNLIWKNSDRLQMPSIVMKTLASELHHCYFQLLFWKINEKNDLETSEEIPQLFAECYVALYKFFDIEPVEIELEGEVHEKRIFESEDKLWHHGKEIGKGSFQFEVINDRYIKQMQVMLRTEEGIVKHNPILFNSESNDGSMSKELTELIRISSEIETTAVNLDNIKSEDRNTPSIEIRRIKIVIEKLLEQLLTLLEKSNQTSMNFSSYSSQSEMRRAQELLLGVGFKTLEYLEEEDVHINDLCWEILIALVQRGEFALAQIGFDQNEKNKIILNKMDKKLERKVQIALTYHEFLGKLLKIAVDSLNLKGLELERSFAEMFCAYAYFRIPSFRNSMLEAITRSNDPELPEWRGIEFSLEDTDYDELKQEVNIFTALFDWSNNFHRCIEHIDKYQIDNSDIEEILNREDWKFRMSKRGITFFQFLKCWVDYVETVVPKPKDIQWKYFPGYNKLLRCFLCEMKKRPILEYPDILKHSLFKLLSNEKLLNPIVLVLFNRANIYEPLTVIRAIMFITEIFTVLSQKNKKIPATFSYLHFYQGIKIVLESEFSFAVSKIIVMIYNHFKMFNIEFRRNISMFLLGRSFFRLFLHWSHNVRDVFYHLLMRIYHESLRINPETVNTVNFCREEVNEEVRSRYESLIRILENNLYSLRQNKNFKNLEKDLHRNLKRKLLEKKKKLRKVSIIDQEFVVECPSSPISERMENSMIFDDNFSKNIFSKDTATGRTMSEIHRPKITYKMANNEKEQEIKALNNQNKMFRHEIYDNTKGEKVLIRQSFSGFYSESDFEVTSIEPHLLEYLEASFTQFRQINELFTKNFNNKAWILPKIQMEMALDSKEIRPEKIDDW